VCFTIMRRATAGEDQRWRGCRSAEFIPLSERFGPDMRTVVRTAAEIAPNGATERTLVSIRGGCPAGAWSTPANSPPYVMASRPGLRARTDGPHEPDAHPRPPAGLRWPEATAGWCRPVVTAAVTVSREVARAVGRMAGTAAAAPGRDPGSPGARSGNAGSSCR
jgi:hypothetical protein